MEKNELNFKKERIPTEEEIQRIYSNYYRDLNNIDNKKRIIMDLTDKACNIYYTYKSYIFPDILQAILDQANFTKKLEFLFLIIEIIKKLYKDKINYKIDKEEFNGYFLYVKEICRCFFYSFNDEYTKTIKSALNDLKKSNIYPGEYIDDLIMELRLTTEPRINDNDKDKKSLSNLVNNDNLKIDYEMINLYKDIDDLKRTNNNNNRRKLIKNENDMIEKQMKLYSENLKQIGCLNELIEICNNFVNDNDEN